jgi:hypothetical protein
VRLRFKLSFNILVKRDKRSLTGESCYTIAKLTDYGNLIAVEDSKDKKRGTALLFLKWDLSNFQKKIRELLEGQNPKELTREALSELIANLKYTSGNQALAEVPEQQLYKVYHRVDPQRQLLFTYEEVVKLLEGFVEDTFDKHAKYDGEVIDYSATFTRELNYLRKNQSEIENTKGGKNIFKQIKAGEFRPLTLVA